MERNGYPELRRLPDAELDVMQALWDCGIPAERSALEKKLRGTHPMAPTTLLTLLGRLSEKGWVSIEKRGRQSVYTPLVSRKDYLASESRSFMTKLCGGSVSELAAALSGGGLTKEELRELRALLEGMAEA